MPHLYILNHQSTFMLNFIKIILVIANYIFQDLVIESNVTGRKNILPTVIYIQKLLENVSEKFFKINIIWGFINTQKC